MASYQPDHLDDVRLASAVASGSVEAWHDFVSRYSGLIVSVVRRHLVGCEEDDWRNAYVETLEHFYASGLAQYDGRAALGTWVITVARSRCIDLARARFGRRREPSWLQNHPERNRIVYRLYFVESMTYAEILTWFREHGQVLTSDELWSIVAHLDEELDPRVRARIDYDLHARSTGAASGRLLEVLDAVRLDVERRSATLQPDYALFEARARELVEAVRSHIDRLPDLERRAVDLHFFQGLPAARIAADLQLESPRRAYTLVGRALQRLRKMIEPEIHERNGNGHPRNGAGVHPAARTKGSK